MLHSFFVFTQNKQILTTKNQFGIVEEIKEIKSILNSNFYRLKLSPDETCFLCTTGNEETAIYSLKNFKTTIIQKVDPFSDLFSDLFFSTDMKWIISIFNKRQILVCNSRISFFNVEDFEYNKEKIHFNVGTSKVLQYKTFLFIILDTGFCKRISLVTMKFKKFVHQFPKLLKIRSLPKIQKDLIYCSFSDLYKDPKNWEIYSIENQTTLDTNDLYGNERITISNDGKFVAAFNRNNQLSYFRILDNLKIDLISQVTFDFDICDSEFDFTGSFLFINDGSNLKIHCYSIHFNEIIFTFLIDIKKSDMVASDGKMFITSKNELILIFRGCSAQMWKFHFYDELRNKSIIKLSKLFDLNFRFKEAIKLTKLQKKNLKEVIFMRE